MTSNIECNNQPLLLLQSHFQPTWGQWSVQPPHSTSPQRKAIHLSSRLRMLITTRRPFGCRQCCHLVRPLTTPLASLSGRQQIQTLSTWR